MSQIETCFFERYAHHSLHVLLGHGYDELVNRDRPDLQSPDGHSLGIEVTRAMEQTKEAADQLLDGISGYAKLDDDLYAAALADEERSVLQGPANAAEPAARADDLERIVSSGYGYGLEGGRVIGAKEAYYWKLAKPLREIIRSKVSKAVCGLYGSFESMGLYVFCKDPLSDAEVIKTMKFTMEMQGFADGGYDTLFLSEISALHVCNLRDGIGDSARLATFDIPQALRRELFIMSV